MRRRSSSTSSTMTSTSWPGVHDLGRVDVLVGPVHFGHVDQAFDAVLDLDERAVVGDVRDLAEHARVRRVAAGNVLPRIRAELLEAQR